MDVVANSPRQAQLSNLQGPAQDGKTFCSKMNLGGDNSLIPSIEATCGTLCSCIKHPMKLALTPAEVPASTLCGSLQDDLGPSHCLMAAAKELQMGTTWLTQCTSRSTRDRTDCSKPETLELLHSLR